MSIIKCKAKEKPHYCYYKNNNYSLCCAYCQNLSKCLEIQRREGGLKPCLPEIAEDCEWKETE